MVETGRALSPGRPIAEVVAPDTGLGGQAIIAERREARGQEMWERFV